ncbi:hypothetical protein EJB05_17017, partial [Eragrostis curvula]
MAEVGFHHPIRMHSLTSVPFPAVRSGLEFIPSAIVYLELLSGEDAIYIFAYLMVLWWGRWEVL